MARTEMDPGPVEVTPVIGHMTFERRLGIRRPSAKGLLQMVRENVHVAFRLLIAATEAAHAAEPQCESGDVRASQHVAACLDVTVLGIQDESPSICHSRAGILILPWRFHLMRKYADIKPGHPAHDDERSGTGVRIGVQRDPGLFEEAAGHVNGHVDRPVR